MAPVRGPCRFYIRAVTLCREEQEGNLESRQQGRGGMQGGLGGAEGTGGYYVTELKGEARCII